MSARTQRYFYLRTVRPANAKENPGVACIARRVVEGAADDTKTADELLRAGWTEVKDAAALDAVV